MADIVRPFLAHLSPNGEVAKAGRAISGTLEDTRAPRIVFSLFFHRFQSCNTSMSARKYTVVPSALGTPPCAY